jgi:hypothetical protein
MAVSAAEDLSSFNKGSIILGANLRLRSLNRPVETKTDQAPNIPSVSSNKISPESQG